MSSEEYKRKRSAMGKLIIASIALFLLLATLDDTTASEWGGVTIDVSAAFVAGWDFNQSQAVGNKAIDLHDKRCNMSLWGNYTWVAGHGVNLSSNGGATAPGFGDADACPYIPNGTAVDITMFTAFSHRTAPKAAPFENSGIFGFGNTEAASVYTYHRFLDGSNKYDLNTPTNDLVTASTYQIGMRTTLAWTKQPGDQGSLFWNGRNETSGNDATLVNTNKVRMGHWLNHYNTSNSSHFPGAIHCVWIFNRELNASEIGWLNSTDCTSPLDSNYTAPPRDLQAPTSPSSATTSMRMLSRPSTRP